MATTRRVAVDILQKIFNEGPYLRQIENGELLPSLRKSRLVQSSNWPPGTRSESVWYIDSRSRKDVVLVHRFLLPDGSLGGSGLPDPKVIWTDDDTAYSCQAFPPLRRSNRT